MYKVARVRFIALAALSLSVFILFMSSISWAGSSTVEATSAGKFIVITSKNDFESPKAVAIRKDVITSMKLEANILFIRTSEKEVTYTYQDQQQIENEKFIVYTFPIRDEAESHKIFNYLTQEISS